MTITPKIITENLELLTEDEAAEIKSLTCQIGGYSSHASRIRKKLVLVEGKRDRARAELYRILAEVEKSLEEGR
jgi:hypothetical protein